MAHTDPWDHTPEFYAGVAVTLSYTTVVTRHLQGLSGALSTTSGSFPTCAHSGYRLMFTIIINTAIFKKM